MKSFGHTAAVLLLAAVAVSNYTWAAAGKATFDEPVELITRWVEPLNKQDLEGLLATLGDDCMIDSSAVGQRVDKPKYRLIMSQAIGYVGKVSVSKITVKTRDMNHATVEGIFTRNGVDRATPLDAGETEWRLADRRNALS